MKLQLANALLPFRVKAAVGEIHNAYFFERIAHNFPEFLEVPYVGPGVVERLEL